ncbi:nucleotide disphospho-sugar-binding domain-containing protein [Streptomyces sp. NPDC059256]|uniref:nucleotide disphospho-sugar-binding domain-containing protein n=1 Tax=Streptomyces sp. NPDC059256 TaxID=3346794 RepID=UPI003677713F
MRVLFTPLPSRTHLYHQAPLIWAFRTAGHDVRVASQPALTSTTVGMGLPAVEVGEGYDFMGDMVKLRSGNSLSPEFLEAMSEQEKRRLRDERFTPVVELATTMAPGLMAFAERWRPHLIVTDPIVMAAPLVAAALGIPLVRKIWGPDIIYGHPLQGQPFEGTERDAWPTGLSELFDRYGVEVRNDYPLRTVDPWPPSLEQFGHPDGRVHERYVPYNGAGVVPDWVLEPPARPRVCVTWGTTNSVLGGDPGLLPRVVRALAPLGIELVVAVAAADRAKLGELPDDVRVAEYLPLNLLLPSCAAMVNQGGAGSVLTGAHLGVPQVLIPETAETPMISLAFAGGGSATVLEAAFADADTIASAVTTACTDEAMGTAARRLRDEIAEMPAPSEVVHTLVNLVTR